MKRILSFLLAITLIVGIVPTGVFAADNADGYIQMYVFSGDKTPEEIGSVSIKSGEYIQKYKDVIQTAWNNYVVAKEKEGTSVNINSHSFPIQNNHEDIESSGWKTYSATEIVNIPLISGWCNRVHIYISESPLVKQYNITYNAVDENNKPLTVDFANQIKESEKDKQINLTVPTLDGYTFKGWESNDVTIKNNAFTMSEKSVTVTAKFEKIPEKYDITYNAVDENNKPLIVDFANQIKESEKDKQINLTVPTLDGYTFKGWESNDVTIKNNAFTMPEKAVTVTAKFEKIPEKYSITFKAVDENNKPLTVDFANQIKESEKDKQINLTVPTLDGYTFKGWESNDVTIKNNAFTMSEKSVTVTAKFEKIPEKYNITFKAVDELKNEIKQTIDAMPVNGKYEFGKEITLPTDLSVKGYKFIGWEVDGKTLADSKFVVPSKDTTVFAKFEKLKSYRVTYKIKESMYYVVNVTLPQSKFCLAYETFNIETPEATGFNCKYKVTDSKNNIIDSTNGKFIMPESNVTIELNYVKNKYLATQCAVDEDGNDISKIVGINAKVYYEYDTIVSLNTMMDFTKYSYKFLGWEVKTVDGEIVPINENGKFKVPAKDILLIAKAAKLKQSYIEFIFYDNLQGNGTSDKNYPKVTGLLEMSKFPYTVAGIKKIAENHLENAKDKDKFEYNGEFSINDLKGNIIFDSSDKNSGALSDIKLVPDANLVYIHYAPKPYSLSYIHNIKEDVVVKGMPNPDNLQIEYGSDLIIPTNKPTANGYTFNGWNVYTIKDGEKIAYLGNKMPAEMVYVEAEFTKNSLFTVKHIYNSNRNVKATSIVNSKEVSIGSDISANWLLTNNNNNYVLSSTTVNGKDIILSEGKYDGKIGAEDVLIVYTYDVDNIAPNGTSDGIPDKDQIVISYVNSNDNYGTIQGALKEVVNIKGANGAKPTFPSINASNNYRFNGWTVNGKVYNNELLTSDSVFVANWLYNGYVPPIIVPPTPPTPPPAVNPPTPPPTVTPPTVVIPPVVTPPTVTPPPTVVAPIVPPVNPQPIVPETPTTDNNNDVTVDENQDDTTSIIIEIEDEDIPLADKPQVDEEVIISEEDIPLAVLPDISNWSLLNLILAVITVISSAILLIGYFFKKDKKSDDTSQQEEYKPKHGMLRLISIIPAVASAIIFFVTQNLSNPMVFADKWSLLMAGIAAIQVAVILLTNLKKSNNNDDTDSFLDSQQELN